METLDIKNAFPGYFQFHPLVFHDCPVFVHTTWDFLSDIIPKSIQMVYIGIWNA